MWIAMDDGFAYNIAAAKSIMIDKNDNIVAEYDNGHQILLRVCTSYEEAERQFNDLLQLLNQ
jgi:hypothetical protein